MHFFTESVSTAAICIFKGRCVEIQCVHIRNHKIREGLLLCICHIFYRNFLSDTSLWHIFAVCLCPVKYPLKFSCTLFCCANGINPVSSNCHSSILCYTECWNVADVCSTNYVDRYISNSVWTLYGLICTFCIVISKSVVYDLHK